MHVFIEVDYDTGRVLNLTVNNNVSSFRVNIAFGISFAFMLHFRVIHLRSHSDPSQIWPSHYIDVKKNKAPCLPFVL